MTTEQLKICQPQLQATPLKIVIENQSSKFTHSSQVIAQVINQISEIKSKPVENEPTRPVDTPTRSSDNRLEDGNKNFENRSSKLAGTQTSQNTYIQLPINENDRNENEPKPNTTAQTNTQVQEDETEPADDKTTRSGYNNTTGDANITQPKHEILNEEEPRQNKALNVSADSDPEKGLPYVASSMGSFQYTRLQTKYKGDDKCIEKFLVIMSYLLVVVFFPFSLFCIFVVVRQYERAVILRNGKVYKNTSFGPGLIHILPCVDVVKFTDLRIICHAVPPQEALTKNSLTISVDAVVYYKICDPVCAVINVTNYKVSTQFLAATTLRDVIGTKKLQELLTDRPAISYLVFQHMKHYAREWGIKIVRVEIKDICLPLQLQRAMAAEAASSRLANAKIIVAKSEIESTRNLQKATTMLMDNPFCMQLRYLQSLQTIAGDKTHTIVFPFSVNFIKKLFK